MVYTDIEAPADKLLTDEYKQMELDDALHTMRVAKAVSNGFPSAPGTTWDYTGADGERAKTVTGTFDGVPGQFTCTADSCIVMTDSDGKLVESMGWRFTPMAPLTATIKDPDVAYAYFGWWLDKPEDPMATHMTQVFAGAVGDAGADVTDEIVGNATYVGPAAGKYATKSYSAGVQTDAAVGHFTASTTLTAKFGDGTPPAGTIGGSVTGFELDDGATPAWSVKLDDAPLTVGNNAFDHTSEATFGPTSKVKGVWAGSFFNDADTTDPTNAPGTVVGTFSAVSDNASLLGAFGATKQ